MNWICGPRWSGLLWAAFFALISTAWGQIPPPGAPVVSIRATTAETLEGGPTVDPVPGILTISRQGPANQELLLLLQFAGTATYGADYPRLESWQTMPAGATSLVIRVLATWDGLLEGDETLVAKLVLPPAGPLPGPINYTIDPQHDEATIVIHDFDRPGDKPIVRIEPGTGFAAETLLTQNAILWAEFAVTRTGELTNELVVFLNAQEGSAQFGVDYRLDPMNTTLSVRLGVGERSANIRLYPIDDTLVEGNETAIIKVVPVNSAAGSYLIDNAHSSIAIVIHDNDPDGEQPVLRIEATQPIAEETSAPLRRLALRGQFTISRTGPTNEPQPVFVHYSGTASPGADYPAQPFLVRIPAGAASLEIEIVPVDDGVPEGIETLVATLSNCPPDTDPALGIACFGGFTIEPAHSFATVFLRDDGITDASIVITEPKDGASFPVGAAINIKAVAIALNGYISRVEFYDGDKMIGESDIVFVRAPDPGTPIEHSFAWMDAAPGLHVLTVRAPTAGRILSSLPVTITVGPAVERVVLGVVATDPSASEPTDNTHTDPAVFTISRLAGPVDLDVQVSYSLSGTAENGVDYTQLAGHILLPAGATSVRVVVAPIADKALEGEETVLLRLEPPICIAIFPPPPDCYEIGANHGSARAVIRDGPANEPLTSPSPSPPTANRFRSKRISRSLPTFWIRTVMCPW